jgi:hypothetical protein
MDTNKGKLKNLRTGDELAFPMNPSEYAIEQGLRFDSQNVLGSSSPVVEYTGGGPARLTFRVNFDQDLGECPKFKEVLDFLKKTSVPDAETHSVPSVEFAMGTHRFAGFLRTYRLQCARFSPQGEVVSASLDAELISDGSFEKC